MITRAVFASWMILLALTPVAHGQTAFEQHLEEVLTWLESADAQEERRAKAFLISPRFYRWLKPHTQRIKPHVQGGEQELDLEILALLDIDEHDRALIRDSRFPSDFIKARVGDRNAFAGLEEAFRKAKHPHELHHLGLRVLYVGTPKAMRLFAERLGSNEVITSQGPHPAMPHITLAPGSPPLPPPLEMTIKEAVAVPLLRAYFEVEHDIADLNWWNLSKRMDVDPESFDHAEHRRYLRRLETTYWERHGVRLTMTCPFLRVCIPVP